MNPWLLFIGPIVAVVFPWTIPFMLLYAIWQATEGGEKPAVALAAHMRNRRPEHYAALAGATRGPLPIYEEDHGRCSDCYGLTHWDESSARWVHDDGPCPLPPTTK